MNTVPYQELDARHKEVVERRARALRQERNAGYAKTIAIVGLGAICAWLGWNNGQLSRELAVRPVIYAVLRDDGTLVSSASWNSLPAPVLKDNSVENALWTYVYSRECYDKGQEARDYYIVQAMSDQRVAGEYRVWFKATNPVSPQVLYGEKDITVHCDFVSIAPLNDDKTGYQIRFLRWEEGPDHKTKPIVWAASVTFRSGIYSSDPSVQWTERATFNAPGVQVVDYPGAQPEPAMSAREASR